MTKKRTQRRAKSIGFQATERNLLRYLEGDMIQEEQNHFETFMEQDPFLKDAVEGLSQLDEKEIKQVAYQIHLLLNKHLKKKSGRINFFFNQKILIWLSVLILLLIILISWWYIQMITK